MHHHHRGAASTLVPSVFTHTQSGTQSRTQSRTQYTSRIFLLLLNTHTYRASEIPVGWPQPDVCSLVLIKGPESLLEPVVVERGEAGLHTQDQMLPLPSHVMSWLGPHHQCLPFSNHHGKQWCDLKGGLIRSLSSILMHIDSWAQKLFRKAEKRLYHAKKRRRNILLWIIVCSQRTNKMMAMYFYVHR